MKKSGQIPAFGNWEYANELPITQYFECARQAGLIRPTSSALCHCPPCVAARGTGDSSPTDFADDLYATDFEKPPPIRVVSVPPRKVKQSKSNSTIFFFVFCFIFYLMLMVLNSPLLMFGGFLRGGQRKWR